MAGLCTTSHVAVITLDNLKSLVDFWLYSSVLAILSGRLSIIFFCYTFGYFLIYLWVIPFVTLSLYLERLMREDHKKTS